MKNIYKKWKASPPKKFKDMPSWVLTTLLILSSIGLWALLPIQGTVSTYAGLANTYGFTTSSIALGVLIIGTVVLPSSFLGLLSLRSGQLLFQRFMQLNNMLNSYFTKLCVFVPLWLQKKEIKHARN